MNKLIESKFVRKILAEGLGTLALLMVVVGSGIMGEQLSNGNQAVALLANSLATGFALYVLITLFAPISGAQFNPAVSIALFFRAEQTLGSTLVLIIVQVSAATLGVIIAHAMFDLDLIQISTHSRTGLGQFFSELIATCGLLVAIFLARSVAPNQVAVIVASYITSAYWFTASTAFANPAVTLARTLTNTFAGIAPANVVAFVVAQIIGVGASFVVLHFLLPKKIHSD